MRKGNIVRFKNTHNKKFLNDSMLNFMEQNKETLFFVEKVEHGTTHSSIKLRKVCFWISDDLLEVVY